MLGTVRFALLAAVTLLTACGGGGGGGGGFLPDRGPEPLEIATGALPDVVAVPYATVLDATGGEGAYEWTLVSDGGTSFTLDAEGVLRADQAIPEGTYGLTFAVTDADGRTAERSLTIAVAIQPFAITTTALPPAVDGTPYSAILEAEGGAEPYSWNLVDDGGTGFTLTTAGVLSGDPPTRGTYGLTLTVTDDAGSRVRRSFLLQVDGDVPQPLAISTSALPQASEGERYAAVLAATGGTGDYSWQLTDSGGSGLSITSDGVLRGTAADEGVYGLTFRVDDGEETVQRSLTLTVAGDDTPLQVETTALPGGVVGTRYAAVVTATGGEGSYSWTLLSSGGSGLSLSSNGVLSGTPGENGAFGITVRVRDGDGATAVRSFVVQFSPDANEPDPVALSVSTETLPTAEPGARYAAILSAAGGTGSYTWTLASDGNSGLTLSEAGVLTGTAPAPGNYGLAFRVNDGQNTATRSLTLSVLGDGPQALTITTEDLPDAIAGTRYATVLNASGGTGDYSWAFAGGSGGTGLVLDASGVLSGVAPAGGDYGITVRVDDGEETVTRSLTLQVTGAQQAPLTVSANSLPDGQVGETYAATLTASGGVGNYEWTLIDDGSTGLTLDSNGALRGTPAASGNFALTFEVADGVNTARRTLTLVVAGADTEPLEITTVSLPSTEAGALYAATLAATGGEGSYTWSLTADGGSGLTLDSNGVLRGTAPAQGNYGLTVAVSDGSSTATASLTLAVSGSLLDPLVISTTALPNAQAGESYSAVFEATGGDGGYTWNGLQVPTGITLDSDGVLSGTAPEVGSYGVTVSVTDGAGTVAQRSYVLTVTGEGEQQLQITTTTLPDGVAGTSYAAVLSASGGDPEAYMWELLDDGDSGLTLNLTSNSPDGFLRNVVLEGTAPAIGSYGITVQVSDGERSDVSSFVLAILATSDSPLEITSDSLPSASTNTDYVAVLEAQGGSGSYTWRLETDGGLGSEIELNDDGILTAMITTVGTYGLTFEVDDGSTTVQKSLVLTVTEGGPQALTIVTETVGAVSVDEPIFATVFEAEGGVEPYTWIIEEDPSNSGFTLSPSGGVLSGEPPAPGVYGLVISVTDADGTKVEKSFAVDVEGDVANPVTIITETIPAASTGEPYAVVLRATGTAPLQWDLLDAGGSGLAVGSGLDAATGVLSFGPGEVAAGSYALSIEVADDNATADVVTLTLTVN